MCKHSWKLRGILAVYLTSIVHGQVDKLSDVSNFTKQAVLLDFENQENGAQANELFSKWGVVFPRTPSSVPTTVTFFLFSQVNTVLRNNISQGSSANLPLIINFRFPMRRVAFRIGNGNNSTTATIRAFDVFGDELGLVQQMGLDSEPLVGVETLATQGISKISLDYGGAENTEQIDDLIFDYISRPSFRTYLAQIGDGQGLRTIIVVANLTNSTAQGELRLLDDSGHPLSLDLNGSVNDTFNLSIAPFTSSTLTSAGISSPVVPGYACIETNVPVVGVAIFQILDSEKQPLS